MGLPANRPVYWCCLAGRLNISDENTQLQKLYTILITLPKTTEFNCFGSSLHRNQVLCIQIDIFSVEASVSIIIVSDGDNGVIEESGCTYLCCTECITERTNLLTVITVPRKTDLLNIHERLICMSVLISGLFQCDQFFIGFPPTNDLILAAVNQNFCTAGTRVVIAAHD